MKYIDEFIKVKKMTEKYWDSIKINENIYGFQIQIGTKWKKGLSEDEILKFENVMGIKFPEILRDFYTVMNGVDKEQINVYGNSGEKHSFAKILYSFPDDLEIINDLIKWIYKENNINEKEIEQKSISRIFPICYHRFVLVDHKEHPVLSMYGNDIIIYANNIIDILKKDFLGINMNYEEKDIPYWIS